MGQALIETIQQSVIGEDTLITTPFGDKPLVYADYTASGRALDFIENYIRRQVLPYYANTHTESSFSGRQTTLLREQARQMIRRSVGGGEDDLIIFCGSGATAAVNKLIDILNLRLPANADQCQRRDQQMPAAQRPVVFIGPYEHHSNELPWRESTAELVAVPLCDDGLLDSAALEAQLQRFEDRPIKIGSFSAASNVTGLKTDVDGISRLLHRYGALACWDYAAAAPYVGIDVSGSRDGDGDSSKDAVFISPHKFIGGPGTPGVLVVKRNLLKNRVPVAPGGGTVLYVTPQDHRFISDPERREEGGTPAIVESIRAGLVFKLQQDVGTAEIERRETDLVRRALARWRACGNIEVLGNTTAPRLSIISLRIKHGRRDLHYGFVVALLNDLFGIQARGGCSCAGPYGHSLLGMDMAYSKALEAELLQGQMILRPGWVRLNFNYFISEGIFDYLLRAVELIAEHGWRLLPFYQFDRGSGVWRFQGQAAALKTQLWDIDYRSADTGGDSAAARLPLQDYLAQAQRELTRAARDGDCFSIDLPPSAEQLRWFVLPQEIVLPRERPARTG